MAQRRGNPLNLHRQRTTVHATIARQVVGPTKKIGSNQKALEQRAHPGRRKLVWRTVKRAWRNVTAYGVEPHVGTEDHRDILERQPGHDNVSRQLDRQSQRCPFADAR